MAALLYNIPRFLEVTWVSTHDASSNKTIREVKPTDLRQNPVYVSIYITWMYLVVMYIVPFASLALLNLRIYIQIRQSTAKRAQLTRQEQREIGMASMLICVVIVFFVCNILALVVNLLEVSHRGLAIATRSIFDPPFLKLMSIAITALSEAILSCVYAVLRLGSTHEYDINILPT